MERVPLVCNCGHRLTGSCLGLYVSGKLHGSLDGVLTGGTYVLVKRKLLGGGCLVCSCAGMGVWAYVSIRPWM